MRLLLLSLAGVSPLCVPHAKATLGMGTSVDAEALNITLVYREVLCMVFGLAEFRILAFILVV